MGLFSSRMTDDQLARAKNGSQAANTLRTLAVAANGHGVTGTQRRQAQTALEGAVGKRQANKLKEDALRQAGARPKGIARLFG